MANPQEEMGKARKAYALSNVIHNASCLLLMALIIVPMLCCLGIWFTSQ